MTVQLMAGNDLLDGLPAGERDAVMRNAHVSTLRTGQHLQNEDAGLDYVYFPVSAVISLVSTTSLGNAIEVGLVGAEGITGAELVLGSQRSVNTAICHLSGAAIALSAFDAARSMAVLPAFRSAVQRQVDVQWRTASRTAACNRLHTIPRRLAKWLLLMADRVRNRDFAMTHETLAIVLGARRAGITEAARALAAAGTIAYSHGSIRILDRPALEAAACECYVRIATQAAPNARNISAHG